jgi:hypothetical protein
VEVYRTEPGGSCVDPGQLLVYQCTSTSQPVAVTGLATAPVDYLGGRFAVPVPAPPADAAVVGIGGHGGQVLASPGDPAGLYVSDGATVYRWPRLEQFATTSGAVVVGFYRPHVFFLGDSVMLGAKDAITAAMAPWDIVFDAEVSRSTIGALAVIEARRAEIQDIVVLQVGTNDGASPTSFTDRLTRLLDALAGQRLVVILTIREARSYYVTDNRVIRDVAAGHPNTVVADWNAVAPPEGLASDGLHLNSVGAQAMATLVRDTVLGWYNASIDRGDDTCRAPLAAALTSPPTTT